MKTFYHEIQNIDPKQIEQEISAKTSADVEKALATAGHSNLEDFKALLSPAALPYLEQMAQISRRLTQKRFGKTMQLYVPLYLSNECTNHCLYCGFSTKNQIKRKTLTDSEILNEISAIKDLGFEHILLVTGEHEHKSGFEYLQNAINLIKDKFALISLEVQPLLQEEYAMLAQNKLNTVYVYQETYFEKTYRKYHLQGKKTDYRFRLETPDRLGKAGIHKIGLGFLMGLENWRVEAFFLAMHLQYLERKYWKTKFSISFPRLRPHEGTFSPAFPVGEKELVQLITAYRLFNENVELSLSTRESEQFRNHALHIGITAMSAGSSTEPGGYLEQNKALKQFEVNDDRSPEAVSRMIQEAGYEPVWRNWTKFKE
ncbi:MAG: 2-iminoacetate synthase ThiH [Bacteroidia bacterium]|nr:MAG: 2-iminoacetate synthase ThiH [Bacteroidia bacterium]